MRTRIFLIVKSLSLVLFIALSSAAYSQNSVVLAQSNADGDWAGTLTFPGGSLPLVLHISLSGASTMDSPSQNANGMPTNVTVNGSNIQFTVPSVGASFKGTLTSTEIKGTFSQNGGNLPLTLTKQSGGSGGAGNNPPAPGKADGDWGGTLTFPGGSLPLVLHVNLGGPSTMDSPSQNANGMPTNVTVNGSNIQFTVPSVGASFKGTLTSTEIKGTFSQNGGNLPLTLTKQ
jgi:hypothetical protein